MSKILIVEDEAYISTQLKERLTSMGYDVVGSASSGEASVDMAKSLDPDLVLMDIVMPGKLNGIAAAQIIKEQFDIPVIFLTAYTDDKLIERAKNVEPFGYIVKPFQEREIKAVIEIAFYKKEMEKALQRAHDELERGVEQRTAELTKAIEELQTEITERKLAEEALRESEERFREMADLLPTIISEIDLDSRITYANKAAFETFGYSQEDFEAGLNVVNTIHPDDRKRAGKNIKKVLRGKKLDRNEYRMLKKEGSELTVLVHSRPIYKNRRVVGIRSTLTDITKIKRTEKALREREAELEIKTNSLEEVNTALRVLLKRRDEDRTELEEKVLFNVRELVVPFMGKLKKSPLDPKQLSYIDILESNLNDIISPFSHTLSTKYLTLTPKEIQVANLIKDGKTTKEIGGVMTLSPRTIETHRKNLRKKLGLDKKKGNLRSHLLTLK